MARVYEETLTYEWWTHVPLDAMWAYIQDQEAQVRFDPRVLSLTVTQGVWGKEGSVMLMAGTDASGKLVSVESELVAVDSPRSYTTRHVLPDVTTTTTVGTEAADGGTAVRFTVAYVTRPANWLERAVLRSQEASRQVQLEAEAHAAKQAVEAYYAARP